MKVRSTYVLAGTLMLGSAMSTAQEMIIYPAKGQSAEQLEKDKYECYSWAKQSSGFDPMALPTASAPPPDAQAQKGGAVKGAVGGAALGAIIGDSSESAGKGAAAGALISGVRQSRHNKQVEQQQQNWEQQQVDQYAAARTNYNRANAACLEGRGYTVK